MERLRALDDGAAREAYWQLQLPETCTRFAPHLPEVQRRAPCAVTTRASPRAGLFVCLCPPRARLPMAAHGTRDHCPRHPGWPRHPTAPHGTPRHPMAPHGTPRHPMGGLPACRLVRVFSFIHQPVTDFTHALTHALIHTHTTPHPHHSTPEPTPEPEPEPLPGAAREIRGARRALRRAHAAPERAERGGRGRAAQGGAADRGDGAPARVAAAPRVGVHAGPLAGQPGPPGRKSEGVSHQKGIVSRMYP